MAYHHNSLLAFALIFNILFFSACFANGAKDIPPQAKNIDKKQPEFLHHQDTVLVPGFGRYMHPKKYLHCKNPFKYNLVTGTCGGNGLAIPGLGGPAGNGGGTGRSFIPGGDDTIVPNPGFEVPTPGSGGKVTGESRP